MYRVKLTEFEGPLDLLLFFIKRDELDITNIPISRITQEFLEYLHLMASLDLEVAGDFIVMAATLMQIKVRMLLPRDENAPEEEDPRAELVRRLVEYKRFKEMSQEFGTHGGREQRKVYYRKFFEADPRTLVEEEDDDFMKDVSLFNLISAYKSALESDAAQGHPRGAAHACLGGRADELRDGFSAGPRTHDAPRPRRAHGRKNPYHRNGHGRAGTHQEQGHRALVRRGARGYWRSVP